MYVRTHVKITRQWKIHRNPHSSLPGGESREVSKHPKTDTKPSFNGAVPWQKETIL